MKIAQLTTHINSGGIPAYVFTLSRCLNRQGNESIVISSGGTMESQFAESGIRSFSFPIKTKFEFHPKLLLILPVIIETLRKEKVDVVHAHTRVAQVLASIIFKRTGIPFVSTCHGFYEPRFGRRIFPSWGAKVIAISDGVRHDLIERHKVVPELVETVYNGVEVDRIRERTVSVDRLTARKQFGFGTSDFVACTVARLVEEKGVADFISALFPLLSKYENLKALIVGEGREKELLMQKVNAAGMEKRIIFAGRLDDVSEALAVSDVFVHPARWVEAFGLSIVEAMSAGLPVLMTRHWALFDLLQDQECCVFVEKGNVGQIKDAIESWLRDPAGVKKMGNAAQATAKKFFDSEVMSARISQIYRDALSKR
ncbi:MAG TPA: glycosyltransferase family 4 protein [Candidatus Omnitrophota bacterium]|nr:glycosyltransferase family 4 protein [Candidatus Omnitrophota bacterium]